MGSLSSAAGKRRPLGRKKTQVSSTPKIFKAGEGWLDEILSVVFFSLSVFLFLSLVSYRWDYFSNNPIFLEAGQPQDNLMGPLGHFGATLLWGFLGWCSFVPVLWCAWFAFYFWNYEDVAGKKSDAAAWVIVLGFVGMLVFSSALCAVVASPAAGGGLGSFINAPLSSLFGQIGSGLISAIFLLLSIALATKRTLSYTITRLTTLALKTAHSILIAAPLFVLRVFSAIFFLVADLALMLWRAVFRSQAQNPQEELPKPRRLPSRARPFVLGEGGAGEQEVDDKKLGVAKSRDADDVYSVIVNRRQAESKMALRKANMLKARAKAEDVPEEVASYIPPDSSLLIKGEAAVETEDDQELRDKSLLIEAKLRDFDIEGRVTHVHPGPVITLFEFEPAPGVKVGKIAALQDDLAMSLRASSIRIIAPIPRRGTVGIEIPNRHRDIVRLRDVLESEGFVNSESILTVPMGKDTSGDPVVTDIAVMPHLLIAGATGTGKSVLINSILLSLLYKASPQELGLILIDPKILELSVYEGIPHLRVPVVTMPKQAKAVLQWAINEMNRRYRLMQRFGVRSIDGYNRVVSGEEGSEIRERSDPTLIQLSETEVIEEGDSGSENGTEQPELQFTQELKPLPKLVIVIDELADLMLAVGREIEELITRLAQKARASGIHLIVATQRPSVDVVTGLIKANFPARLSFRVASRVDSKTILDRMGAEKLLGLGDMLFMQPGAEALKRVHGAYVSDAEVKRVIDAVKKNAKPLYDPQIIKVCEQALQEEENAHDSSYADTEGGNSDYDTLYDKAVELVVDKGQASTSMVQRAFRIGYNRAARIIEMMEKEGVIGPMDGVKPREVLVGAIAKE